MNQPYSVFVEQGFVQLAKDGWTHYYTLRYHTYVISERTVLRIQVRSLRESRLDETYGRIHGGRCW